MIESIQEFFQLIFNIIFAYINIIVSWLFRYDVDSVKDLNHKVIVITGSANGVGKEIVFELTKQFEYIRLALIDICQDKNNELIEHLKYIAPNAEIIGYTCDITDGSEVDLCCRQILNHFGHVDILINNAGIVKCLPLLELTPQDIRQTFDVNVFGQFWMIKNLLPSMIERKNGHIISVSSMCGLSGKTNLVDYCASKHAVVGMMRALDCELREMNLDDGIHLTTICPLAISTGMFKRPSSRFHLIMPILTPEYVAKEIVDCMKQKLPDNIPFLITIPKYTYWMSLLENLIPRKIFHLATKFLAYEIGKH